MTIEACDFKGKKVIVRVDFNVPLDENGKVTDDTRIRGALPTLKKVLNDGGSVIMMSHMGKPKGKVNPKLSLSQIVSNVSERLGVSNPARPYFLKICAFIRKKKANLSVLTRQILSTTRQKRP